MRIPGRGYPCARVRENPQPLALGSDLFAVNFSIGDTHNPTISRGILSGYPEFEGGRYIQTDASVNPGSSGGPLFDQAGTTVGITVAKIVREGAEGLGFAVPSDVVIGELSIRLDDR